MECGVCSIRSSVGYCAACKTLLCEQCSIPCEECRALSCPNHIHITRSNKKICHTCHEERVARRTEQVQRRSRGGAEPEDTAFADEAEAPRRVARVEAEALDRSGYKRAPLWRVSLYTSVVGAVAMLFVLVFTSFQFVLVPLVGWVKTPYILAVIPLIALFWALIGFFREPYYMDRLRCLFSAALAVVTIAVGLGIMRFNAVPPTEGAKAILQSPRDGLTPAQLEAWRKRTLGQFEQK